MAGVSDNQGAETHGGQQASEPMRYPTNSIIAVFDTEAQLTEAIEALTSGGFIDSEITVSCGAATADRLKNSVGRRGLAGLALRIADRLGLQDEEMEIKGHYEQALRDGKLVLRLSIPTEDRKDVAAQILREHGAHSAAYHGRFTIEGLSPPNNPPDAR